MKMNFFKWLNEGPVYSLMSNDKLEKILREFEKELRIEWEAETMEFTKIHNKLDSDFYDLEKEYNELLQKNQILETKANAKSNKNNPEDLINEILGEE